MSLVAEKIIGMTLIQTKYFIIQFHEIFVKNFSTQKPVKWNESTSRNFCLRWISSEVAWFIWCHEFFGLYRCAITKIKWNQNFFKDNLILYIPEINFLFFFLYYSTCFGIEKMPSYHCWTAARHSSQQKRVVAPKHGGGCVQYFGIWQWYGNRYTQILAIHGCNYRWVIQNFHPFYFWYFFVAIFVIFVRLKVVFNSKYIKHEMTIVRISAKGFFLSNY